MGFLKFVNLSRVIWPHYSTILFWGLYSVPATCIPLWYLRIRTIPKAVWDLSIFSLFLLVLLSLALGSFLKYIHYPVLPWRLEGNSLENYRKNSLGISPFCYSVLYILAFLAFLNSEFCLPSSRRILGSVWIPLSCLISWAYFIFLSRITAVSCPMSKNYCFIEFAILFLVI